MDTLTAVSFAAGALFGTADSDTCNWLRTDAALAANALIAEARLNERDADRLRGSPFAMRRPPAQQAAFVEKLKSSGLSLEHRNLLRKGGDGDEEINLFQKELLDRTPDQIGFSAVEWLSRIAASRRELASMLNVFAQSTPGAVTGTSSQAFLVGNPHDKEETIDLLIRRISLPADWKLSVVAVEEQAKVMVREIEPGKHYAVTLPAKVQLNVASVVVPVGEVGANTTARWAVEGRIGDELIGGMVHEMNVPYVIPDLTLPPVGSKEVEEELLPTSSKAWVRTVAQVAAGILVMGMLVFAYILWHRRRPKVVP